MPSKPFLSFFFSLPLLFTVELQWFFQRQEVQALHFKVGFLGWWFEERNGELWRGRGTQCQEPAKSRTFGQLQYRGGSHSPEAEKPHCKVRRPKMTTSTSDHVDVCGRGCGIGRTWSSPFCMSWRTSSVWSHLYNSGAESSTVTVALRVNNASVTRQGGTWSGTRKTPECLVHSPPSPSHTSLGALQGNSHLWGPADQSRLGHTTRVLSQPVGLSQACIGLPSLSLWSEKKKYFCNKEFCSMQNGCSFKSTSCFFSPMFKFTCCRVSQGQPKGYHKLLV